MKKYDICALGELLIDFTDNGQSEQGNPIMEANPGGAPCNLLAMASKLGCKTVFIGKVGNDIFGRQLRNAITNAGIDSRGLVTDNKVNTTLAFVKTSEGGEREFSFYRNPGADMMLSLSDIDYSLIKDSRVFHFGSLSMTSPVCEEATKRAIEVAKKSGVLCSFDPNLRENLWSSLDLAHEKIAYGMSVCDVLKISDNEILWFTGCDDYDTAVKQLQQTYNIPLIFLTLGADGSRAYTMETYVEAPVYNVNTIEKTGAGDTFFGCILAQLLENNFSDYSAEALLKALKTANAAASLITARKGALCVMPSREEINKLMEGENL